MAIVNEVVTKFSFDGNLAPLTKYNEGIAEGISSSIAIAGAIAGVTIAMGALITATLKNSESQALMAQRTGESFQAIQELGFVASLTGSSAEALESTMENLSAKIGDASLYGSEDFARLGVSIRGSNGELKKSSEVLDDVRQKFNKMNLSQKQKVAHLGTLGIDPSLVGLLSATNSEMETMRSKAQALGVVTDKQGEQIIKYNDSLTVLQFGMKSLGIQTSVALAPKLGDLADGFSDFLMVNKELVGDGIGKVVDIIMAMMGLVGRFISTINNVISNTIGWKTALIALGAVLTYVFLPIYIVPAAIIAIIVVLDDLMVAIAGGDSVISGLWDSFMDVVNVFPVLRSVIDFFGELFAAAADTIFGIIGLFTGELDFSTFLDMQLQAFSNVFGAILNVVSKVVISIKSLFSGMFDWITDNLKSMVPDWAMDLLGGDDKKTSSNSTKQNISAVTQIKPVQPQSVNNSNKVNAPSLNQDIVFNITSDDPDSAASKVQALMQGEFATAQTQLNRGGGR